MKIEVAITKPTVAPAVSTISLSSKFMRTGVAFRDPPLFRTSVSAIRTCIHGEKAQGRRERILMNIRLYTAGLDFFEKKHQRHADQADDSEEPEVVHERRQLRLLLHDA